MSACPACAKKRHKDCVNPDLCQCQVCKRLLWSDPPKRGGNRSRWIPDEDLRAVLKESPGKWARVFVWGGVSSATTNARKIRTNQIAELPSDQWEASSGGVGDGSALWLRYIGPKV